MVRASENSIINKRVLLRTYKIFKQDPKKTFVNNDFGTNPKFREKYLNTLISLNLVELVPALYMCGGKLRSRREIKGYRLKELNSSYD